MKKLAVYTLAACSLISSSCATMLKGTKDEITVVSDPSGAAVTANETQEGSTPVTFDIPSKQGLYITVSKAGYQPEDLHDPVSFRWGYEAWAFIAYIIPMIVDLSDGAAWGHDHLTMTAHLEPNGQATTAAAAAVPSPSVESPSAANGASGAKESPVTAPSPAARIEAVAAAPASPPAAIPSAAGARQPAASVAPSLPE